MTVKQSDVEKAVIQTRKDGKLSCKRAFNLAEKLEVTPRAIGKAANATKTKIVACQLGMFK